VNVLSASLQKNI
jgi:GTPase involved in cell partitioning and DNA repair